VEERPGWREDAIMAVNLAHHAVSEPVCSRREFDRHVGRLLEPVEAASLLEDLGDDSLSVMRSKKSCSTIHW